MQQSVKAEDPFQVGKFGIGFNSVYHITGKHSKRIEHSSNIKKNKSGQ